MNVQSIEVTLIDPPKFNSRLTDNMGTPEQLKALGESMQSDQEQPIRVVKNGGERYRLIFGSRRLAAAKTVGMKHISADVLEGTTEGDEILANGVENVQRRDLTTYEQARLCAALRAHIPTSKEVAIKLGLSPQHVSNLAVCYELLPDAIKSAWQHGDEGTDINFLRSIVTRKNEAGKNVQCTEQEMLTAFHERVESLAAVDGNEDDDDDVDDDDDAPNASAGNDGVPVPAQKFTVYKDRYRDLLRALRAVRAAQVTIDACRYLVGDIEKIRGVPIGDPKAPTKKTTTKKGDK